MRKSWILAAALAAATVGGSAANATVITFDAGSGSFLTSYVDSGVTFTPADAGTFSFASAPNGTTGLLGDSGPRPRLRADIAGGATFVSVDLGDFNADADLLFLDIFNASNTLLGHTDLLIDSSFSGMQTLSLSASGIAYAVFGSTAPSINGSSVFADNFTFTPATGGVPEPAAWALMLAGFFGMGSALRRTRVARA